LIRTDGYAVSLVVMPSSMEEMVIVPAVDDQMHLAVKTLVVGVY
jgi:hypothetical protein